ncbi:MAG: aminotransferase class V-fold PLP-dependent enzyme [Acidimicrobiales bacterium]
MPAYLDHAASTPMRPAAVEAMTPYLVAEPGNPSGSHAAARRARRALDDARDVVAHVVGGAPGDVVFTAGGTEADNLAVLGVHDRRGGTLVASAVEHHAVLDPVLARGGAVVPVRPTGQIDLDALAAVLDAHDDVGLVSVMLVNNEVGVVNPMGDVAAVVRAHAPGALLHTDAVQAPMWLDLRTHTEGADLVSISAHKLGGPKGVGALVVRPAAVGELAARTLGGGQERGRRGGTQNVAGVVAMACALRITDDERDAEVARLGAERARLVAGVRAIVPDAVDTVAAGAGLAGANLASGETDRPGAGVADPTLAGASLVDPSAAAGPATVAGIAHLCLPGTSSESLLFLLDDAGVCASAAASCSSGALEVSHVLAAMGVAPELAEGSLRLSLGWSSTAADVDAALAALPPAVERLRVLEGTG